MNIRNSLPYFLTYSFQVRIHTFRPYFLQSYNLLVRITPPASLIRFYPMLPPVQATQCDFRCTADHCRVLDLRLAPLHA